MTRLIFINRFFFPDESATAMMLTDLVRSLEGQFSEVHVIASKASYTANSAECTGDGSAPGAKAHLAPVVARRGQDLGRRIINYVLFYLYALGVLVRLSRRAGIVICLTDPPLAGTMVQAICRLRGMACLHWHQDIFPETATRLGILNSRSLFARLALHLRNRALAGKAYHVAIGERMREELIELGAPGERISLIPNWSDEEAVSPMAREANALRREWGYEARHCVVGYSGNLGRAHDALTIAEAIRTVAQGSDDMIRFLFIGAGAGLERLKSSIGKVPEELVQFRPYQPRERLSQSLSVADIHLATLRPELEGLIVPSKIYGIFASARPLLFIGDPDGEVARIVHRHRCGCAVEPGNWQKLLEEIERRASCEDLRLAEGQRARELVEGPLSKHKQLSAWRRCIDNLAAAD